MNRSAAQPVLLIIALVTLMTAGIMVQSSRGDTAMRSDAVMTKVLPLTAAENEPSSGASMVPGTEAEWVLGTGPTCGQRGSYGSPVTDRATATGIQVQVVKTSAGSN